MLARALTASFPAVAPAADDAGVDVRLDRAADALVRLEREWAELAREACEPNAFMEPWLFGPAVRNLAGDDDVRLLEVRQQGLLIGLIPLVVERGYGSIPVRHVTNWCHDQCFLGTPLVRAGREAAFWSAALAFLDRSAWAEGFLHLVRLNEDGPLLRALKAQCRECDTILRRERALLQSGLSAAQYYETSVRKKKRKELKRLFNRLAELGTVEYRRLAEDEALDPWCDAFLALEARQWKGEAGTALACRTETERFFRDAIAGARAAGRLDFLRLDLDGRPLAMLVTFLTPPGAFSFKIAFDPAYAQFSPGVLIEVENLALIERPGIEWVDSCAMQDHAMINSLWRERRAIVRVTLPLAGARRRLLFRLCRMAETGWAAFKGRILGMTLPEQPR